MQDSPSRKRNTQWKRTYLKVSCGINSREFTWHKKSQTFTENIFNSRECLKITQEIEAFATSTSRLCAQKTVTRKTRNPGKKGPVYESTSWNRVRAKQKWSTTAKWRNDALMSNVTERNTWRLKVRLVLPGSTVWGVVRCGMQTQSRDARRFVEMTSRKTVKRYKICKSSESRGISFEGLIAEKSQMNQVIVVIECSQQEGCSLDAHGFHSWSSGSMWNLTESDGTWDIAAFLVISFFSSSLFRPSEVYLIVLDCFDLSAIQDLHEKNQITMKHLWISSVNICEYLYVYDFFREFVNSVRIYMNFESVSFLGQYRPMLENDFLQETAGSTALETWNSFCVEVAS